jgi:transposase InsO family protein
MASAPAATAAVIPNFSMNGVLSWRLSNTLTAGFCVEALSEALARFGKPDIFNTDQGAQFTSDEFTQMRVRDLWRADRHARGLDGSRAGVVDDLNGRQANTAGRRGNDNAAAIPRPSPIPPVAMIGTDSLSANRGKRANSPTDRCRRSLGFIRR